MSPARLSELRDERGAVLVITGAVLMGLIMFVAFVVDTANWFEHKRHLQLQVDAAASAGAVSFNSCASASGADQANPASTANAGVVTVAKQYGGSPSASAPYNTQVGGDPNIAVLINSSRYPNEGGADNTDLAGPPCQAGYVDAKATDSNLPWFFGGGLVPAINAHARVSINQISILSGSLPLAVEDDNPLRAAAIFVDETAPSTSPVIAVAPMGRDYSSPTTTKNGQNVDLWDTWSTLDSSGNRVPCSGCSASVPINSSRTGVVIALSDNKNWSVNTTMTLSQICNQPLVSCFSNPNSPTGLLFIQGYTTAAGTITSPKIRSVTLRPGTCTLDADSTPYYLYAAGCAVEVRAQVDFGVTGDPTRPLNQGGANASLTIGNGNSCALTYSAGGDFWRSNACPSIAPGSGGNTIDINWHTGSGSSQNQGTFQFAARPYAADTNSGPIIYAWAADADNPTNTAYSYAGGTHHIDVAVGLVGSLKTASGFNDPAVTLKFVNTGGGHTGAITCAPGNLASEIASGCTTSVSINPGEACPNSTTPVDCLQTGAAGTGNQTGQVKSGFDTRYAAWAGCPPNNWVSPGPGQPLPTVPSGDPRLVPVIVTRPGAFIGSGSNTWIPVTNFAAFYITGWSNSTCTNNEAYPGSGQDNGAIWGHYVTYWGDLGNSTGTVRCDFSAITPCVPVMTK